MGVLELRFSDIHWKGAFRRLLNHITSNVARLRFMFDRNLLSEDLRKLLRQPPIGGCSHRKGMGPYVGPDVELGDAHGTTPRPLVTDYNVYLHTFAGGQKRIRCNRCGEAVWNNDPRFPEWLKMVEQSTNRPSAAEQVIPITPEIAKMLAQNNISVTPEIASAIQVVFQDKIDLGKEQE